jgi:allantoin racemase
MSTLYVINPNSSRTVTEGIDAAIARCGPWRRGSASTIACLTLAEGPPGIESQAQADLTIPHLLTLAGSLTDAAAFVIACFGDPGLHALRDRTEGPSSASRNAPSRPP